MIEINEDCGLFILPIEEASEQFSTWQLLSMTCFFFFFFIFITKLAAYVLPRGLSRKRRVFTAYPGPRERNFSASRCPLSYRVSTARRNFCSPGHVQLRNRYAEEKISMIIATVAGAPRRETKLRNASIYNGVRIGPSLLSNIPLPSSVKIKRRRRLQKLSKTFAIDLKFFVHI